MNSNTRIVNLITVGSDGVEQYHLDRIMTGLSHRYGGVTLFGKGVGGWLDTAVDFAKNYLGELQTENAYTFYLAVPVNDFDEAYIKTVFANVLERVANWIDWNYFLASANHFSVDAWLNPAPVEIESLAVAA